MALYGRMVKPARGREDNILDKCQELALIQQMLPEEMMLYIFAKLPVSVLGFSQCVCKQWKTVGASPSLWRAACDDAFFDSDKGTNTQLVREKYRGCWKQMFLDRQHLRFDGVYAARITYIRTGITEWTTRNPCHLVQYFRYYKFFPDGTFLYRTTPETVGKIAKSLMSKPRTCQKQQKGGSHDVIHSGRYIRIGDNVHAGLRYDNSKSTEIRTCLKLRSTVRGANNRLDIVSIVSWDREGGVVTPLSLENVHEQAGQTQGAIEHRRGLATCEFVPWESTSKSILNLSTDKMDFYVPG